MARRLANLRGIKPVQGHFSSPAAPSCRAAELVELARVVAGQTGRTSRRHAASKNIQPAVSAPFRRIARLIPSRQPLTALMAISFASQSVVGLGEPQQVAERW